MLFIGTGSIFSQNLEEVGKTDVKQKAKDQLSTFRELKPFGYSGSFYFNSRAYNAMGIPNRQNPFSYSLGASANAILFEKVNVPFSFMYFDNGVSATHPFTSEFWDFKEKARRARERGQQRIARFGMSPYYKWATLHLGHRVMNFSPYTLNGLTFFGAGTELNPESKKIRAAAMYGRLTKATPIDLSLTTPNLPQFERVGWGFKIGYGDADNYIDLISFSAKDAPNSIGIIDNDSLNLFPDRNHVVSIIGQKKLYEILTLRAEIASSAYTEDARTQATDNPSLIHPKFLIPGQASTEYQQAMKFSLGYEINGATVGATYERIDPRYQSMGAFFFNNDLENYTLNFGFPMLDGKIITMVMGGFQNNNLEGSKETQSTRIIGSVNTSYQHEKLSVNLDYSNFQSKLEYVLNPELDSLNAVVVNQNINLNANYILSDEENKRQNLGGVISLSKVNDDIDNPTLSNNSDLFVASVNHTLALKPLDLAFTTSLNFNQNSVRNMKTKRYGVGESISKDWLDKKLNTTLTLNFFHSVISSLSQNNLQSSLNTSYNLNKHNIGVVFMTLSNISDQEKYTELVLSFNYNYTF